MTRENKPAHKGLKWLKTLLGYGLFILVVSVALDAFRSREMPETLPPLAVQSLAGSQLDIAAMSMERPVILYYWASWCGVCPLVSGTVDGFSDSEQVVTVALQSGNNTQVKQYLQNKGYGFEVVNDPSGAWRAPLECRRHRRSCLSIRAKSAAAPQESQVGRGSGCDSG